MLGINDSDLCPGPYTKNNLNHPNFINFCFAISSLNKYKEYFDIAKKFVGFTISVLRHSPCVFPYSQQLPEIRIFLQLLISAIKDINDNERYVLNTKLNVLKEVRL